MRLTSFDETLFLMSKSYRVSEEIRDMNVELFYTDA
jgi:hypothetical protein